MKQPGKTEFPPLIILAGGKSERFGSPKGLAQVDGHSLLHAHINSFLIHGSKVVVVVGHIIAPYVDEVVAIAAALPGFPGAIQTVTNPRPADGPFSSLQVGIASIGAVNATGVFVLPVDTGVPPAELYLGLEAASAQRKLSVIPQFGSKGGHPVFLSAAMCTYIPEIDPCSEVGRLDVQLSRQNTDQVVRLPVSWPAVLENRNVPV